MNALDKIMEALFIPYRQRVPDVGKIVNAMVTKGIYKTKSNRKRSCSFSNLECAPFGLSLF